jgi:hypothetical protein
MEPYLVNLGQLWNLRSVENSQSQANHLQVLASCSRRDIPWFRANIVDDALLQPWDQEMRALVDNCVLHSGVSIEDDSSRASLHVVHRGLNKRGSDGQRDGRSVDTIQCLCHLVGLWGVDGQAGGRDRAVYTG